MSVQQMALVWALYLPHTEAWVLMALADHADHNGKHVYPSVGLIAWKTGYSKRQVFRALSLLQKRKLIKAVANKGGKVSSRAVTYELQLWHGENKPPYLSKRDDP